MKRTFFCLLAACYCLSAFAQSKKACNEGGCCSKSKNKKSVAATQKPLACKLTSKEMQERKATVIAELKSLMLDKKELRNGYSYKFKGEDANLDRLVSFVKSERACCDFFDFSVSVKGEYIYLDLTGPKGAKEFVDAEIGM